MIEVVAAIIINHENKVLIAKRKKGEKRGGLWEFPGGKIETGETPEESLIRELREEMDIHIKVNKFFGESIYSYQDISIKLIAYYAEILRGEIRLKAHDTYQWVKPSNMTDYKFAAADIPFVEQLIR